MNCVMSNSSGYIILIDTDVVFHFLVANRIESINKIFPFEIMILPPVHNELEKFRLFQDNSERIIHGRILNPLDFPADNPKIEEEYLRVKKDLNKGAGESACLAYAKLSSNIIASSNLRDTHEYCKRHSVKFLTTMDFLFMAKLNGVFTEEECNEFIKKNKEYYIPQKLPANKISDYIPPSDSFINQCIK